ncbi:hypothetical protein JG687_00003993 [Phytophthora cactorum]|uniref:Uncharacterized protein n=1 Tax=Phytophthora cactorum TaxID=29920 RepID=A0A329T0K1_9STRA|nr:hypothetical protein Pcac1_g20630 [Phytophthora cactorum]KAG2835745.1 hypothetical protein PC111_g5305 [Phytophthora cactorum]KAG2837436.1 hypothetical protein PC112_g4913 [Phytophthora cactorum]KAG2859385.1 hypothetical protein PC113_g8980 [Phytophthora cactorum]KAG2918689.1 hypothetical protein PC114_g6732 [Phytophthora cactorum]
MVLEHRRTIICKSGSTNNQQLKSKVTEHCTESITRSKRVHHRRRMLARQNQYEFNQKDDAIIQTDLIEISLTGGPVLQHNDSVSSSDSDLVEGLIECAKSGDLRSFQRACARATQCHVRLDTPGYMGWTAAHWAAREGHVHLLEHLTICHANLDAVDLKGDTLLHKAAANGQPASCEWLLERGFSVKMRNNNNLTPLDLAQEHIVLSRRSIAAVLCERLLSKMLNTS